MRWVGACVAVALLVAVPAVGQMAPDAVFPEWMQNTDPPYKGFERGWALISAQELKRTMDMQAAWKNKIPLADGTMPAKDPKLVVIDVAHPQGQYMLDGHIPGAINIWRPDYEAPDKLFGARGENLMTRADFQAFLRTLGIDNDSMVVWYDHN